jgi:hypothetical protein
VNRQHIYTVLVVFVTMLAFSIANVIYTNRVDAAADRRNQQRARDFCGVIVLIDDRNRQVPPKLPPKATAEQTEQYDVQVKFVAAIHAYRIKLGC